MHCAVAWGTPAGWWESEVVINSDNTPLSYKQPSYSCQSWLWQVWGSTVNLLQWTVIYFNPSSSRLTPSQSWCRLVNSLAHGGFQFNFSRWVIFKLILLNCGWGISYEIALTWMPLNFTDHMSTLVQVMAWCHQAPSHYLNQCWPRSPTPYSVTRPQWVKHSSCTFPSI